MEYKARDIAAMPIEEVWGLPDLREMALAFDDGVIVTSMRATIYSRYIWEIHRAFPETPLCIRHHVGNRRLGSKTHLDLMSEAIRDYRDHMLATRGIMIDMEPMGALAYSITNQMYNELTVRLEEYVSSTSILDFIEVMDHPAVEAANRKLGQLTHVREADITAANEAIRKVLLDRNELKRNGLARAFKGGMVSENQALQCVGSRGYATDVDSHIFPQPILPGFAQGMTRLVDTMMESRSASVAALNAKDPMQKSEYMNRNIQLSSATLSRLHMVDCGSRDYLPFTISNKDVLRDMEGMYYLDETNDCERVLRKGNTQLLGKTVKFRTIFTCKHADRYGFCARCFGELAQSIPAGTNIGHVSASEVQSKVGQLLLSTKHLLASAKAEPIILSDHDRNYLNTGRGDNCLYLLPGLAKRRYKLVIAEAEAPNLGDVASVPSTDLLIPYRLSELTYVQLLFESNDSTVPVLIQVSSGSRKAALSREMLRHVKSKGWSINEDGNYVVDMDGWEHTYPFVELPVKHFSTVDYMLRIADFIKGSGSRGQKSIMAYDSPSAALQAFHDLVSTKLEVPVPYLQTIILGTMVQSRPDRNYHLPFPREAGKPAHYGQQMKLRSLAAAMAYQGQYDILTDPASYLITDRPEHPLDAVLMG